LRGSFTKVAIIGGGISGICTAQQLIREGINDIILFEKKRLGGLIYYANRVENFPGFIGHEGREIARKLAKIVKKYEIKVIRDDVLEISKKKDFFIISGKREICKAEYIVLATGTKPKKLGIKGEIYHPEWRSWDKKDVLVIGGGDVAYDYALRIKRLGGNVKILIRKKPRALFSLQHEVEEQEIEIVNADLLDWKIGRNKYVIETSKGLIACDKVICAIGREPELPKISFHFGKVHPVTGGTKKPNFYMVGSVYLPKFRQCMICGGMGIASAMEISDNIVKKNGNNI
jgi:thioredoxin reductase